MQRIRQVSCVVLALKKAGFYRCGIIFFLFCRRLRPKNSSTYSTRLRLGSLRISQNFKGDGGGGGGGGGVGMNNTFHDISISIDSHLSSLLIRPSIVKLYRLILLLELNGHAYFKPT